MLSFAAHSGARVHQIYVRHATRTLIGMVRNTHVRLPRCGLKKFPRELCLPDYGMALSPSDKGGGTEVEVRILYVLNRVASRFCEPLAIRGEGVKGSSDENKQAFTWHTVSYTRHGKRREIDVQVPAGADSSYQEEVAQFVQTLEDNQRIQHEPGPLAPAKPTRSKLTKQAGSGSCKSVSPQFSCSSFESECRHALCGCRTLISTRNCAGRRQP